MYFRSFTYLIKLGTKCFENVKTAFYNFCINSNIFKEQVTWLAMNRRPLAVFCLLLLVGDTMCQHLEAYMLGKALHKVARIKHKAKAKDKKAVKYGVGAVLKAGKGTFQGVIGKPLKVVGVVLGPLGLPIKAGGTVLKAKSVANKVKSGVLTVKKLSRDSVRFG